VGQEMTLKRLANRWDFVWHEHEHYKSGKEFVVKGLEKKIFKKLDNGAIITDLQKFGLTDTVVQKSDGTSLYITQDIALTKLKLEKYKADKLFWVIGPEQSLAMQQMFAVCEELGIGKRADFTHIPYGYMSIKGQGKMSSRKGNVVFIDDIIDSAKNEIKKIMAEKETQIADIENVSEILALGAVKFGVLKVARMQDVSFDISESTSLQGDSGPYLQYATVRANSILKKSGSILPDTKMPDDWQVTNLERMFEKFESVVLRAGSEYAPHYIVTYLIQLAGEFNSFYARHKIIDEADPTSPYKLAMTQAFVNVMTNGLDLLGISVPEEM
jgi:arginyl-tRNA synthetase